MKSIYYLIGAMANGAISALNLLQHDYWAILSIPITIMFFGFYLDELIKTLTIMPKPKKEENIYE